MKTRFTIELYRPSKEIRDSWETAQVDYMISMGEIAKAERELPSDILLGLSLYFLAVGAVFLFLIATASS